MGGGAKAIEMAGKYMPGFTDKVQEWTMFRQEKTDQPASGGREGILRRPSHDLSERMAYPRHVFESSTYTEARLHPLLTGGAGLAVGGIWAALRGSRT